MKHFNIFLVTLASASASLAADYNISSGQLGGLIDKGELQSETVLRLKGHIDARDLAALERLPLNIRELDLSGVSIDRLSTSSRTYFGKTLFKEGEIPAYTFFKTGVETLILPLNLTEIGEGAFAASSIRKIAIPEGVEQIGDYAFYGCSELEDVTLPASLNSIGKGAFGNCTSLASISLAPTKITEIPERAFAGDVELTDIVLPSNLEKIGREAFTHTSITTLDLSSVKEFEPYALSGMPFLELLSISSEASVGAGLLMDDTSLASLSGAPADIPDYFAANCGELDADAAMSEAGMLGKYSFANNKAESLVLTQGLMSLDRGVIAGMANLKNIDATALEGSIPTVDNTTFEGISQPDITLLVTADSYDQWKNDPVWGLFNVVSDTTTGADSVVSAEDTLRIMSRGDLIIVESPEIIESVDIFTPDGKMVYDARPSDRRVEISRDNLPSGILIVKAADVNGRAKSVSILK